MIPDQLPPQAPNSENSAFFEAIFESAAVGIIITDINGNLIRCNARFQQMLGYSVDGLRNRHFASLTYPDDVLIEYPLVEQLIAGKIPSYQVDKRYIRQDETVLWTRVTVSLVQYEGTVGGLAIVEDITEQKETEQRLAERERFIEHVMNTIPDVVHVFDLDKQKNVYTNRELVEILGYTSEEIQQFGDSMVATLIHPDDLPSVGQHQQRLKHLSNNTMTEVILRMKDKNGSWHWMRSREVVFMRNEAGEVTQILGVAQDITEQRQAVEALRASEAQYRLLADHVTDLVGLYDIQANILYVSPSLEHNTGWRPEEVAGKNALDFVHPDDYANVAPLLENLQQGEETYIQWRCLCKNGAYVWMESVSRPVVNEHGQPYQIVVSSRNISERKRTEEALRRSEEQYRALAHNFPNGMIALYDHNLRFFLVDGKGLEETGMQPEMMEGKTLQELFPPDVYERDEPLLWQALQGEAVVSVVEYEGKVFQIYTVPIYDGDGAVYCGMVMTQDITSLKQAEQNRLELALEQKKNEVLTEFLDNLSHDLKTPLSVIMTSLDMLERYPDRVNQQRKIDSIKTQAKRLQSMIQGILTMSRLDHAEKLRLVDVELYLLLLNIVNEFQPKAEQKKLKFTFQFPQDLPPLRADQAQINRMLVNLVENAVIYTPQDGNVHIHARKEDGNIVIEVTDTGIGIAEADLPHIFDRFYRADRARSIETGGSGLGLAIVKKIVEMHNGQIDVISQPGQGTTVTVSLSTA